MSAKLSWSTGTPVLEQGWGASCLQQEVPHISEENVMPKMKTSKAAAKRFKVTKKGKIKRKKAYASHIMTKKSAKRRRNLRKGKMADKSDLRRIKQLLPGA